MDRLASGVASPPLTRKGPGEGDDGGQRDDPPAGRAGESLVEELKYRYEFLMDGLLSGDWPRFLPAMLEAARVDAAYREEFNRLLEERRANGREIIQRAIARGDLPTDVDGDWILD